MDTINKLCFDIEFLQNKLYLWALVFGLAIITAFVLAGLSKIAGRMMPAKSIGSDIIGKTKNWFLLLLALFGVSFFLELSEELDLWRFRIFAFALAIQGGLWLHELVFFYLRRIRVLGLEENVIASGSVAAINFVVNFVVWSLVGVFILSNLGFNVTALLTGLGVGGIAVALAVQNILGDLFSSLSIVIDKPFRIGDMIIVDQHKGFVENIGLKTTRIRSLSGEELVFSNSDLLKCRIRNFKKMKRRRNSFEIGVVMQTPIEKLKMIPGMAKSIIEGRENITFDRAHFRSISDCAYQYEIVYFLEKPDMGFYLDTQQEINLEILKKFEAEGIELAYPTQTLHVQKEHK